jgi:hypothetical protein
MLLIGGCVPASSLLQNGGDDAHDDMSNSVPILSTTKSKSRHQRNTNSRSFNGDASITYFDSWAYVVNPDPKVDGATANDLGFYL